MSSARIVPGANRCAMAARSTALQPTGLEDRIQRIHAVLAIRHQRALRRSTTRRPPARRTAA